MDVYERREAVEIMDTNACIVAGKLSYGLLREERLQEQRRSQRHQRHHCVVVDYFKRGILGQNAVAMLSKGHEGMKTGHDVRERCDDDDEPPFGFADHESDTDPDEDGDDAAENSVRACGRTNGSLRRDHAAFDGVEPGA